MRISRDTERRARRVSIGRQAIGVHELINLSIWAIVFVAAGIILEGRAFNAIAPFLAFGMVLSTMVVRWARGKR